MQCDNTIGAQATSRGLELGLVALDLLGFGMVFSSGFY